MKFDILANMKETAGKATMQLAKHSPAILVGVGVVGVVGAAVLACRATLKAEDILEEHNETIAKHKEAEEEIKNDNVTDDDGNDLTPEKKEEYLKDVRNEVAKTYLRTGGKLLKAYAPAIIIGGASIYCIVKSHDIQAHRLCGVMAAYSGLQEQFKHYRAGVIAAEGPEADHRYNFGLHTEEVTMATGEKNEDGQPKTSKEVMEVTDIPQYSEYSKFFDASSPYFKKDSFYNLTFLRQQQEYANQKLRTRGHVFLNEIYDALGIPRTPAGAVVGWVKGNGDDVIDFGIYNEKSWAGRSFVNGYEPVILLDFNVDGVIWDKI